MASFSEATNQAKQFWVTRTSTQKTFLLAGAAATLVMLALMVRFMGTSEYKPLFTGLETNDAQTLTAQLDAEGIPHKASADGKTISVPADKLDAARLKTAAQGQPHSGRMGFELFDKMSWGQTEFDQKVAYQRAMEGELERTIETLGDVESARVHLVMPTDSVFIDKQRPAKASVIVKLRGKGLPKSAVVAISRMVAGAVDELSPEDVSIVDADSARSLGLHSEGDDDGEGGIDATLTQRLISTLEPVVGVDKVRATVKVDRSLGSTEEHAEKYDPSQSALLSMQRSEDSAGGNAVSQGVPGTGTNIPVAKNGKQADAAAQGPTQSSKTESAQYGVNKVVTTTMTPAGEIEHVSAAILVDDAVVKTVQGGKTTFTRHKRTPDELARIQELAQAIIGFDAKRGDTVSVQNLSFDSELPDAETAAPTWMDKTQKTVTGYSSVLKPISLLLLFVLAYMFVLRPIQKTVLAQGQLYATPQGALAASSTAELPGGGASEIGNGLKRAAQLKTHAVELVRLKPMASSQALQTWLREEQS